MPADRMAPPRIGDGGDQRVNIIRRHDQVDRRPAQRAAHLLARAGIAEIAAQHLFVAQMERRRVWPRSASATPSRSIAAQ